jgi:hypothetical protein
VGGGEFGFTGEEDHKKLLVVSSQLSVNANAGN